MSLADYPNQFAVFCKNLYTKLMADKRVWWIKRWRINENSLYNKRFFFAKWKGVNFIFKSSNS